jgi:hypothetical protein
MAMRRVHSSGWDRHRQIVIAGDPCDFFDDVS